MKTLIIALSLIGFMEYIELLPECEAWATDYTTYGTPDSNITYGSDGSSAVQIDTMTYHSNGVIDTQVGNTTYSSDGNSHTDQTSE